MSSNSQSHKNKGELAGIKAEVLEQGRLLFEEAREQTRCDNKDIAVCCRRHTGGYDESGEYVPSFFSPRSNGDGA